MIRQLHIDNQLSKQLRKLERSGKKAALAAAKTQTIIERLQRCGTVPDQAGTVTKHGELRIKGVMKFDLGSGYRLVTFKRDDGLFLLYAGSHDDCHRWIENNRELTAEQIQQRCTPVPAGGGRGKSMRPLRRLEPETPDPLEGLDEQILRRIFCGLAGERT